MAQAVSTDTRSTFLAKLLAPVGPTTGNRQLLAELRREAERAWSLACHRYWAAHSMREHRVHLRRAAEIEHRSLNVPEAADQARAQLELVAAIDRMMHVPAPTIGALRQKQKLRMVNGGRDRWDAAIAADETRLDRTR